MEANNTPLTSSLTQKTHQKPSLQLTLMGIGLVVLASVTSFQYVKLNSTATELLQLKNARNQELHKVDILQNQLAELQSPPKIKNLSKLQDFLDTFPRKNTLKEYTDEQFNISMSLPSEWQFSAEQNALVNTENNNLLLIEASQLSVFECQAGTDDCEHRFFLFALPDNIRVFSGYDTTREKVFLSAQFEGKNRKVYLTLYSDNEKYSTAEIGDFLDIVMSSKDLGQATVSLPALPVTAKPVIYLYPQTEQQVTVKLKYQGILTSTYPRYSDSIGGWQVIAKTDGTLTNTSDHEEYSYLFWEGINDQARYDLSKGFVVKGSETEQFLKQSLKQLGLTPKEYNEFIVYWLPKMEYNPYNLIHFATDEYTRQAPLEIFPQPDSMQRVFMVFKPLKEKVVVQPQTLEPFERTGFSVIEWGGTELE